MPPERGWRRDNPVPNCRCACRNWAEHDEGQAMQTKYRAMFNLSDGACVGCVLGDDGPAMHDYSYGCEYYVG